MSNLFSKMFYIDIKKQFVCVCICIVVYAKFVRNTKEQMQNHLALFCNWNFY